MKRNDTPFIHSCSASFISMASLMPTLELAQPLPSFQCVHHSTNSEVKTHKHIQRPLMVNSASVGVGRVSTAVAGKEQPTPKPKRDSQAKHANTLLMDNESRNRQSLNIDSVLQDCTDIKTLKQVHAHAIRSGLEKTSFLELQLVVMYAKFRSMDNARLVFDKIYKPDVFLWNVMIRGYTKNGLCEEALTLYYEMRRARIRPDKFTFPFVVNASACLSDLQEGKKIHDDIVQSGFGSDVFVDTTLVDMYAKCGSIEAARQVFDKMSDRNVVSWSAIIAGYARNGDADEALVLFRQMLLANVKPNSITITSVFPACGHLAAGKWFHGYIIRNGLDSDVFVGTCLIDMYAKCGTIETARQVFDKMSQRNAVTWSAIIAGYAQNGDVNETLTLLNHMRLAGMKPDSVTMLSVLPAFVHLAALRQAACIHGYIIRSGFETDVVVGTTLIDMYSKCKSIDSARIVFDKMADRNVFSWTAVISAYAQNGHRNEALTLLCEMLLAGITPNSITVASVLPICADLAALQEGKCLHAYIIKSGFEADVVVGTALFDMYAKCGRIEIARRLFDKMSKRNVVSWNAMISHYAQNGDADEALRLFNQMRLANVKPDSVTMVTMLAAFTHFEALQQSKPIHGYIIKSGFDSDVVIGSSLIDMYSKCTSIEFAKKVFDEMPKRNVFSWTAMIGGYAQNGRANEALALFNQIQLTDLKPDLITIVSVLPACAHLATLQQGKCIHGYIIRSGFESDIFVQNSLIDMYAKCGSIEIARHLFDKMFKRDVVSWNAMIAGYGMHGHGKDALALFSQMKHTGMKPNSVTLVSVLSACSHAGLVDEGWQYFDCMAQDYHIAPRVEHYACMVDLLGRAGHLEEAEDFIKNMPLEPSASVWGALLGACKIHSNIDLGERVAERLFHLDPENVGYYVLLSNIYAAAGRWDDVAKVRIMMKDRDLKKAAGCSLIEVNNRVHAFLVGDKSHPQSDEIYAKLEALAEQMEELGYVPNTNFVLHDMEEEVCVL